MAGAGTEATPGTGQNKAKKSNEIKSRVLISYSAIPILLLK